MAIRFELVVYFMDRWQAIYKQELPKHLVHSVSIGLLIVSAPALGHSITCRKTHVQSENLLARQYSQDHKKTLSRLIKLGLSELDFMGSIRFERLVSNLKHQLVTQLEREAIIAEMYRYISENVRAGQFQNLRGMSLLAEYLGVHGLSLGPDYFSNINKWLTRISATEVYSIATRSVTDGRSGDVQFISPHLTASMSRADWENGGKNRTMTENSLLALKETAWGKNHDISKTEIEEFMAYQQSIIYFGIPLEDGADVSKLFHRLFLPR